VKGLQQALESATTRQLRRLKVKDNAAFQLVMVSLREAGIKVKDIERIEKAVNSLRTLGSKVGGSSSQLLLSTLPDAPDAAGLVVPAPWHVDGGGVVYVCITEKGAQESRKGLSPFYPSGRLVDQETGQQYLRLTWKQGETWYHIVLDREVCLRSNKLSAAAQMGFPVSSQDSKPLVSYLQAIEHANIEQLPSARVCSRLGWLKDGSGFLAGKTFITAEGRVGADLDPEVSPSLWPAVGFRGTDQGDDQLCRAFHSAGTLEGWCEALEAVRVYPRVMLAVYASFVPPLLAHLGCPNFGVDFCGPTSGGKTTTLMLAGSVWGDVRGASESRVWSNWHATEVSLERRQAVHNGVPFILDDTKQANVATVVRTLYNAIAGTTRGRGTAKIGQAPSLVSRTVLISTGESSLVGFSQDGGTRARVLTLWGSPFEATNSETAAVVRTVRGAVGRHYGTAGPRFVEFLLTNQHRWPEFIQRYENLQERYRARAEDNPVVDRQAPYVAAIALAAQLVHEALELPWDYTDPIEPLWGVLMAEAAEADRAREALQEVASWVAGCKGSFEGPNQNRDHEGNPRPPFQGWFGRWGGGQVAIRPELLRRELEGWGYTSDAILRTWHQRGWLLTDSGRKTKKVRFQDSTTNMIVLTEDRLFS